MALRLLEGEPKQETLKYKSSFIDWIQAGFPLGGVPGEVKKREVKIPTGFSNILKNYEKWTATPT